MSFLLAEGVRRKTTLLNRFRFTSSHSTQLSESVPVDLDLGDLHEVSAQIGLIVACQLTGDDADEAGLPVSIQLDDTSYFSMVAFTDQRISPNT